MAKGLKLAEPPQRRERKRTEDQATQPGEAVGTPAAPSSSEASGSPTLFAKVRDADKVQFNKRVEKAVADGYAVLAIRTGKKVPDLLKEGLAELEKKYGKS